jgi:predicted lipoprotein with Yx(FWY)xxD motif
MTQLFRYGLNGGKAGAVLAAASFLLVACGSSGGSGAAAGGATSGAQHSAPGSSAPANSVPANSAPANSVPANSAPGNYAPGNSAPANSAPPNSAPANSAPAGAASVLVRARSGPLGTFLTDGSGKTLYMFASDTATKSTCSGACLTYWPPLNAAGGAKAGSGAKASELGTITGTNGAKQVSYGGHPLYYYAGDRKPGDTSGQDTNGFGAKWWVLAPSGKPITSSNK